jgi:hypothetical protein
MATLSLDPRESADYIPGGVDPRSVNKMLWAAFKGNPRDVLQYHKKGATFHDTGREGRSALHEAVIGGHVEVVRTIIKVFFFFCLFLTLDGGGC